jgi:hypothetical protein
LSGKCASDQRRIFSSPSVSPRAVYAQRGTNTLQRVFRDHFASFASEYDAHYAKELGNSRIERISRVAKPISSAAILAYQPFGDALRFNPHFHALILEGGFDPNGQFSFLPIHDTARLTRLLRQRTVGLFLKLGLITERFSQTLLCWRHSGFSVDNSVRLDGGDHAARQALAQYIARAPLSLQKLTYDRSGGKILYRTSCNPYFKQNTSLWSAPDFIAHLTQFIPPWGVRSIHYYGLYSSRCKAHWSRLPHIARVAPQGWKQFHAEPMSPQAEATEPTTVSHAVCRSLGRQPFRKKQREPAWARLIAKVC